jgi:hypothetical protein
MNKIRRFKDFKVNEEWGITAPTKGEGGGVGSKTVGKFFRKMGKLFGDSSDILNDYLLSKVDSGEITEQESDQIFSSLELSCKDKNKKEIQSMVDEMLVRKTM